MKSVTEELTLLLVCRFMRRIESICHRVALKPQAIQIVLPSQPMDVMSRFGHLPAIWFRWIATTREISLCMIVKPVPSALFRSAAQANKGMDNRTISLSMPMDAMSYLRRKPVIWSLMIPMVFQMFLCMIVRPTKLHGYPLGRVAYRRMGTLGFLTSPGMVGMWCLSQMLVT